MIMTRSAPSPQSWGGKASARLAVAHLLACGSLLATAPSALAQGPWVDPPASLAPSPAAPTMSADPPASPSPPATRPDAGADLARPAQVQVPIPGSPRIPSRASRSRAATPTLTIINARVVPAADVTVRVGQGAVTLGRPLASGGRATLKLPKTTGCIVSVFVVFEDESTLDVEDFDICQKNTIRFTD